jgi:hypothetical protein
MKFQWFHVQGTTVPLDSPFSIRGMNGHCEEIQPFDVFVHTYNPAMEHPSKELTTQLWVWESVSSPGLSETFSWKSVTIGYICPGPGELQGRHLVTSDQGEPAWVSGSTAYRWYKEHIQG